MKQVEDLTYIVDNEVLLITTEDEADKRLQVKVYPVADLVLPIDSSGHWRLRRRPWAAAAVLAAAAAVGGGFGGGGGGFGGGGGGFGGGGGGFGGGGGGFGGGGGGGFFAVPDHIEPAKASAAAASAVSVAAPAPEAPAAPSASHRLASPKRLDRRRPTCPARARHRNRPYARRRTSSGRSTSPRSRKTRRSCGRRSTRS